MSGGDVGGSLSGPSRLGASPNTDTGGEYVAVPRALVSDLLSMLEATRVGLHGTQWAQAKIRAVITALSQLSPTKESGETAPVNAKSAIMHLDGWGGRTRQACVVVGETPKRYRVRARPGESLRVPNGRNGLLTIYYPGTRLVPKRAITFPTSTEHANA